jgi:hypothetical protein
MFIWLPRQYFRTMMKRLEAAAMRHCDLRQHDWA